MKHTLRLPIQIGRILLGCTFTIIVLLDSTAFAQSGRYRPTNPGPPPRPGPPGAGRGGSCTGHSDTTLTALAPLSHVGTTHSPHPLFAWYVPDPQPLPIEFRLYAYDTDGNLQPQPLQQVTLQSSPGIMTYLLPETEPGLSAGETYYWQVALLCDPSHPSRDLLVSADITVVDPSSSDYSGGWYDELKAALEHSSTSAGEQTVFQLLSDLADIERTTSQSLATQVDIAQNNQQQELQLLSAQLLQQSEQLMNIITAEQQ